MYSCGLSSKGFYVTMLRRLFGFSKSDQIRRYCLLHSEKNEHWWHSKAFELTNTLVLSNLFDATGSFGGKNAPFYAVCVRYQPGTCHGKSRAGVDNLLPSSVTDLSPTKVPFSFWAQRVASLYVPFFVTVPIFSMACIHVLSLHIASSSIIYEISHMCGN